MQKKFLKKIEENTGKMANIYKVAIFDRETEDVKDMICFRPSGDGFGDFMEEIFSRMPYLRSENLKLFYEGKIIFICSILLVDKCNVVDSVDTI